MLDISKSLCQNDLERFSVRAHTHTHRLTHGTDSITSTADMGGKKSRLNYPFGEWICLWKAWDKVGKLLWTTARCHCEVHATTNS